MSKETISWHSERLDREITLVRWGDVGRPLLVFPTAGGDAEEIERFHLVSAIGSFLAGQQIKVYSVDSLAGRAWLAEDNSSGFAGQIQNQYDAALYHEVVPAIRKDCGDPDQLDIITAGASLGAFNALAFLCRHPDVCKLALCMSGTFGLEKFIDGPAEDYYYSSPLHFIPDLDPDGDHIAQLRECFVLLTHGEGQYEDPDESWRVADVLGAKSIPNRVDSWGEDYRHDWVTWREMLPKYLAEFVGEGGCAESTGGTGN